MAGCSWFPQREALGTHAGGDRGRLHKDEGASPVPSPAETYGAGSARTCSGALSDSERAPCQSDLEKRTVNEEHGEELEVLTKVMAAAAVLSVPARLPP